MRHFKGSQAEKVVNFTNTSICMTVFIYITSLVKTVKSSSRCLVLLEVDKNSMIVCFTARGIHYAGIVLPSGNAALPVVCLQDDQENGENDYDAYDNDSDHRPRT